MLFILISGIQRGWGEVAEHLELGYFSIVPLLNGRYQKPEAFVGLAVPPSGPGSED